MDIYEVKEPIFVINIFKIEAKYPKVSHDMANILQKGAMCSSKIDTENGDLGG